MSMIDIHTHILPNIDDGSNSVEETVKILETMASDNVTKIVATPHYYCHLKSLDHFLESRKEAFEKIADKIPEGMEIKLGAEVRIEYDIYKQDLTKLAFEGTNSILLEMPYIRWDEWIFDEIFKIRSRHGLDIIVAHIDRYVDLMPIERFNKLFELDLKYQVNVDFLGSLFNKSSAMMLMKENVPHFIGSDCHNMTTRPPCLGSAVKKIKRKCGKEILDFYMSNAEELFVTK